MPVVIEGQRPGIGIARNGTNRYNAAGAERVFVACRRAASGQGNPGVGGDATRPSGVFAPVGMPPDAGLVIGADKNA